MLQYTEQQQRAVTACCDLRQRIIPVTGEAGTGKTTMIQQVYERLTNEDVVVVIAAPTGKAAKRIFEATGIEARTIHRLLEYPYPGERDAKTGKALTYTEPKRDRSSPIPYDVILCDEYAMVTWEVHNNLLAALPRGGCIRMFGDLAQLPPIELNKKLAAKPSPFKSMLERFDGFVLDTTFRQTENSGILRNAHLILTGRVPRKEDDFTLDITSQPLDALMKHVLADDAPLYDTIENQIIIPGRRTWVGTYKVNALLQNIYNPNAMTSGIKLPRHEWEKTMPVWIDIGDKVVWTQNTYDLRSYPDRFHDPDTCLRYVPPQPEQMILNGETGIITDIVREHPEDQYDPPFESFTIDVGDRKVFIPSEILERARSRRIVPIDPRGRCGLAYALTTHKTQGSEYRQIVYLMNKSLTYMLGRHNFYTGITRAKEHVHVITDMFSIQTSVTRITNQR